MEKYSKQNAVFGQPDYTEWNASGGTVNVLGFDVSLMYTDTNIDGDPNGASEMIVLTVSRSF